MIRHILILIWNRKRSLAWIFIEQVLVFGVLLFCFIYCVDIFKKNFSEGNVSLNNIAYLDFTELETNTLADEEKRAYRNQFHQMVESMKDWPSVEFISMNGSVPTVHGTRWDSISFNGRRYNAAVKYCDENYCNMFSLKLSEGEWFSSVNDSETPPAVITQLLADNAGLSGSAIGQSIYYNGRTYRITGVVKAFKDRVDWDLLPALFMPISLSANRYCYTVKYKPEKGADFSKAFLSEFFKNFPRNQFKPRLTDLYQSNKQWELFNVQIEAYILGIPTVFLLIFAFLGTFGIVWMQSKKRMTELGLRMAFGCTPARLQRTIIIENLILTTFAMLPGLIVIANLYAFAPKGWEWIAAVVAAIVLMCFFSAFSAWYPAWKASSVQPVEALRLNQ